MSLLLSMHGGVADRSNGTSLPNGSLLQISVQPLVVLAVLSCSISVTREDGRVWKLCQKATAIATSIQDLWQLPDMLLLLSAPLNCTHCCAAVTVHAVATSCVTVSRSR